MDCNGDKYFPNIDNIMSYFKGGTKIFTALQKQKIKDKITDSIKAIAKRKSKGFKVGQLKFKSEVNVPLKPLLFLLDRDLILSVILSLIFCFI